MLIPSGADLEFQNRIRFFVNWNEKARRHGNLNCLTQDFELLLPSVKV
jgi:hypothetical protein